jgi:hypothetical protein
LHSPHHPRPPTQGLLKALTLRAYRCAVKVVYDAVAMGDIDTLECDSADAHTLLIDALRELDASEWYVGPEDAAWSAHVRGETPNLFNVKAAVDANTGSGSGGGSGDMRLVARTARLGAQTLQVGRLSAAAIGAFWTSLSLEMQYFANDDDERYSIQGMLHLQLFLNHWHFSPLN